MKRPAAHDRIEWSEEDDEVYERSEESDDCYWCGGEGEVECPDPIECTRGHRVYGGIPHCRCASCGGSGRAADMTIW